MREEVFSSKTLLNHAVVRKLRRSCSKFPSLWMVSLSGTAEGKPLPSGILTLEFTSAFFWSDALSEIVILIRENCSAAFRDETASPLCLSGQRPSRWPPGRQLRPDQQNR